MAAAGRPVGDEAVDSRHPETPGLGVEGQEGRGVVGVALEDADGVRAAQAARSTGSAWWRRGWGSPRVLIAVHELLVGGMDQRLEGQPKGLVEVAEHARSPHRWMARASNAHSGPTTSDHTRRRTPAVRSCAWCCTARSSGADRAALGPPPGDGTGDVADQVDLDEHEDEHPPADLMKCSRTRTIA